MKFLFWQVYLFDTEKLPSKDEERRRRRRRQQHTRTQWFIIEKGEEEKNWWHKVRRELECPYEMAHRQTNLSVIKGMRGKRNETLSRNTKFVSVAFVLLLFSFQFNVSSANFGWRSRPREKVIMQHNQSARWERKTKQQLWKTLAVERKNEQHTKFLRKDRITPVFRINITSQLDYKKNIRETTEKKKKRQPSASPFYSIFVLMLLTLVSIRYTLSFVIFISTLACLHFSTHRNMKQIRDEQARNVKSLCLNTQNPTRNDVLLYIDIAVATVQLVFLPKWCELSVHVCNI